MLSFKNYFEILFFQGSTLMLVRSLNRKIKVDISSVSHQKIWHREVIPICPDLRHTQKTSNADSEYTHFKERENKSLTCFSK